MASELIYSYLFMSNEKFYIIMTHKNNIHAFLIQPKLLFDLVKWHSHRIILSSLKIQHVLHNKRPPTSVLVHMRVRTRLCVYETNKYCHNHM